MSLLPRPIGMRSDEPEPDLVEKILDAVFTPLDEPRTMNNEPIPPTVSKERLAAAMRAKGYDGLQFELSPDGKDDVFILYKAGDASADFATKSWPELLKHLGLFNPEPGTRNPEPGASNAS